MMDEIKITQHQVYGSFVGKILPEGELDIEAKRDGGALPKMGYGPKKQPPFPSAKVTTCLRCTFFWTRVESVRSTWMLCPV